jgi:23S rRNA maturation mini-RNase III
MSVAQLAYIGAAVLEYFIAFVSKVQTTIRIRRCQIPSGTLIAMSMCEVE